MDEGRVARHGRPEGPAAGHRQPATRRLFKKVYESAEFKKFMDERGFEMLWGDAPQFAAFMKKDNAEIGDMLKLMGLAK